MIPVVHAEAAFVAAYVVFLVLVAIGLEWVARFSHRQSHRSRTIGFRFHQHVNAWECSEGNYLWLQEVDQERRLAHYKGDAKICNACGVKHTCTDGDNGRELVRSLNAWTHTEMGQFQRVMSLTLLLLAAVIAIAELIRHHNRWELILLVPSALLVFSMGVRVLRVLREINRKVSHALNLPVPLGAKTEINRTWKKSWW
jgi:hypothetical protein